MKKVISIICLVAMLVCGCGNGNDKDKDTEKLLSQPYNISLVAEIANNNPVFDANIDEISDLATASGSTYSCILADSTPNIILEGTIKDFSGENYTEDMMKRVRTGITADIIGKIEAAKPDSPEVDLATATSMAVRKLRSDAVANRNNLLVYYGSGISTTGLIDMIKVPICEMDVEASVKTIADSMDVDMTGIEVIWYCCGEVAGGEQKALSDNEKKTLKKFYEKLFVKLGAESTSVSFMDDIPQSGNYDFDQKVSVMKTEGNESGLNGKVIDGNDAGAKDENLEKAFSEGNILAFDEKSIAFKEESTELEDKDNAKESMAYVISYMQEHPDFQLLICGTTTSAGEESSCIEFSENRAEAIRILLVDEAGISSERVHTLGCGWSSCLYVNDRGADGELNECAEQNRSVKLVDYNSQTAQEITDSLKTH